MATEFGKKLKELREAKKFTQGQIATSLGVTTRQVQRYEENTLPRPDKIKALNKIFKFDFFTLLDDSKGHIVADVGLDQQLSLGDLNITLKDYLNEVRQQKEFLQQLLIDKIGKIDSNLSTALGGVIQLSLHVESAREVALKSLARLEKKPQEALTDEADKIVIQLMKEHKKQGSFSDGGK